MTEATRDELILDILSAKRNSTKTWQQIRRLERFDAFEISGINRLIAKIKNNAEITYFASVEEVFDMIQQLMYIGTGNGGRDRLLAKTSKNYAYVTRELITLYLSMCEVCHQKKVKRKRRLVKNFVWVLNNDKSQTI